MKKLIVIFLLLSTGIAYAQIRAFDNSKAMLPWLYNPSVDFSEDFQAYFAYAGGGNSNFTPQSILAGTRIPVLLPGRKNIEREQNTVKGMMGVQVLSTSQDLLNDLNVNVNLAQQIPINKRLKLAMGLGVGIHNIGYDYDALVYIDQQDPLLLNAEDYFGFHLNAGFSLVMDERIYINLATPYLLKYNRINIDEIILRVGYIFYINQDFYLLTSANLDTQNHDLIYGGDIRAEIRKMVSVVVGADRYKYHCGLLLNFKPFALGYAYGQNYKSALSNLAPHQISVISSIPMK